MLNGREVDVCIGESEHCCVIVSGYDGKYPFRAQSMRSGYVYQKFTPATAKILRETGSAPNMKLVK